MKKISYQQIKPILNRYPNNYIKNLNIFNSSSNNKCLFNPDAKYYILKPKGKRAYIWFTYIQKNIIPIIIFMNNRKLDDNSNEFYEFPIQFDPHLCYNNIVLYGYYFTNICNKNTSHYFIIENVYNYNIHNDIILKNDYNYCYNYKLQLFSKIMNKIKPYNNYFIKLPIILDNNDDLFKLIYNLDYNIFSINVYSTNKYLGNYIINNSYNNKITATFKITSCINEDLYNLFIINNNIEQFYDLALIDSYKTSKFMNKLFRKIKENHNLDLLEESDTEEEFENINKDKYIYLDKTYLIECEYNSKFKKWIPKKLSNNKIINFNTLIFLLGKNNNFKKNKIF